LLSRAVKEDFHLLNKIGEGRHCAVYEAQNKFDGEVRAIKVIMKGKRSKEEIVNEVELMRRLDHPNIIRLFEVYESSKLVTLVLEHCRGGELFRYLCREKSLRESTAASIMAQILSAVAYLHEAGITHRDVKPENVLLKFEDNVKSIKLIDFGISLKKDELTQIRGSEYYLAPEAFTGAHSRQVDLWAAGVLLYMLVSGRLPFCGHNFHETISLITHSPVDYSLPQFGHTSPELLDLLHGLL
jgi:calcium-dependent protein kinase